jgi:hypothetical protein
MHSRSNVLETFLASAFRRRREKKDRWRPEKKKCSTMGIIKKKVITKAKPFSPVSEM